MDMRWGVNEEMTLQHATADVCIKEVTRSVMLYKYTSYIYSEVLSGVSISV